MVSAASDLRFAFVEIGEAFERETGLAVTFNFGATGHLARQIERGAPVDVFASADEAHLDALVRGGLVLEDTKALYGLGSLVLFTRDAGRLPTGRLQDLLDPGVRRIAIANPDHAPYGRAAREALESAGLWEVLQPKLVLAENVNQAFQYARTGNVEVAIVARSLAAVLGEGVHHPVPRELHGPLDQAIGVVAGTGREAEARAFASFVNGPEGRAILGRYGLDLPTLENRAPPEPDR